MLCSATPPNTRIQLWPSTLTGNENGNAQLFKYACDPSLMRFQNLSVPFHLNRSNVFASSVNQEEIGPTIAISGVSPLLGLPPKHSLAEMHGLDMSKASGASRNNCNLRHPDMSTFRAGDSRNLNLDHARSITTIMFMSRKIAFPCEEQRQDCSKNEQHLRGRFSRAPRATIRAG